MNAQRALLAVHAHPDDECISMGGALARYAADGVRTILITCTDGAVGEISDPALATPDNLAEVRSRELDASVGILKIARLVKLGYRDSGMAGTPDNEHPESFAQANLAEAVERVVRVIREERPQIVVTYDENGGYGHPDHIRSHLVGVAAFHAAGDPTEFPNAGPAWSPDKLYYVVTPQSAVARFAALIEESGLDSPWATRSAEGTADLPRFGVDDERVTTRLDVSDYISVKRASMLAHRTQLGADMWFLKLPEGLFARMFATEFFECVSGPVAPPEDDLFADVSV
jgi:N-acetyl-1-D-myo-inositol-2-amino-2-deoxy-alpha-D-glucopyranoside deacetylase